MPARTLPTQFTATRALSLAGTPLASGASLSAGAVAKALGNEQKLAEFVNRGWLLPDLPLYPVTRRRSQGNPRTTPTWSVSAREFRQLLAS